MANKTVPPLAALLIAVHDMIDACEATDGVPPLIDLARADLGEALIRYYRANDYPPISKRDNEEMPR